MLVISAAFFLIGAMLLTALASALRRIQKRLSKKELKAVGNLFFYQKLHNRFFHEHEYEGIFFSILSTLNFCRFLFASALTLLFLGAASAYLFHPVLTVLGALLTLILSFTISDYLPRIVGNQYPIQTIWVCAPIASIYLTFAFPITFLIIKVSKRFTRSITFDYLHENMGEGKQELYDIIQESDLDEKLEPQDKKLIESVVSFQDLIAKEVMVPRVDLFALPLNTTIKDAALKLQEEGYSRTPVYKGTIDNITGLLMYKDILAKYMESQIKNDPAILDETIEKIIKPVLYTPETKKISHLLQEFRKKQMHLAIVVDEYGGTEGIITIEDILEKIVGDIEDEYDTEEDDFTHLSDGSVIVDPKMSIIDLEEELDIKIPEEGDYDTLGGYIFHKAGEIPPRGFHIRSDHFELEVLRVSDRAIEKVKIRKK